MVDTLRAAVRSRDVTAIGVVLHWVSLAIAFVILLEVNRGQWFNLDEWDFLVDRGVLGSPRRSLWTPHNEHWSTVPILAYRALFSLFGVRTYVPYLLLLVAMNLVTAHLLWRLMRRVGVHTLVATAGAAVFAVLGAGWENLTSAFQMSLLLSLALGILALLILPERGPFARPDAVVVVLLVVSLMSSGVGVTMTAVVALAALLRRGPRVAAGIVMVPAALYVVWFAVAGRHVQQLRDTQSLGDTLRGAPGYVWRGLTDIVDDTVGLTGAGVVLLVLLVVWLARAARPAEEPWPLVVATASGAVMFLGLVSLRRQTEGIENAGSPRYATIVVALLLPALLLGAQRLVSARPLRGPLLVGGTALLVLVAVTRLYDAADTQVVIEQEQRQRILAAAELRRSGEEVIFQRPAPLYSPELEADQLEQLDRDGKLPSAGGLSEVDRLTARLYQQVRLAREPAVDEGEPRPRIEDTEGLQVEAARDPDCVRLVPEEDVSRVLVDFPTHGTLQVRADRSGPMSVSVVGPDGVESRTRPFDMRSRVTRVLSVAQGGFSVRLHIPREGATTLCGLASE